MMFKCPFLNDDGSFTKLPLGFDFLNLNEFVYFFYQTGPLMLVFWPGSLKNTS